MSVRNQLGELSLQQVKRIVGRKICLRAEVVVLVSWGYLREDMCKKGKGRERGERGWGEGEGSCRWPTSGTT